MRLRIRPDAEELKRRWEPNVMERVTTGRPAGIWFRIASLSSPSLNFGPAQPQCGAAVPYLIAYETNGRPYAVGIRAVPGRGAVVDADGGWDPTLPGEWLPDSRAAWNAIALTRARFGEYKGTVFHQRIGQYANRALAEQALALFWGAAILRIVGWIGGALAAAGIYLLA